MRLGPSTGYEDVKFSTYFPPSFCDYLILYDWIMTP
jgi:hypothetical protein